MKQTSIAIDAIADNQSQSVMETNNNKKPAFFESFISFDEHEEITIESELSRYLKHPIKQNIDNVNRWWLEHELVYPTLFKFYLKYSCVPASSASSERDFSTSGNILTDKRSVMLPSNVNDLIVARNKF